jgi:single-stranded-DNA-specific exonuclease
MMGAKYVDFLVPNRFEHGYGLSPEIVNLAVKEKQPDLIITVDNGISSIQGVALAKSLGIRVIVTDHHLPNKVLPDADAIINPNLLNCQFLSKNLAGVGVCFYLFSALKTHLKKINYFKDHAMVEPDLRTLLDFVALGTVADVVRLDQNNRILVAQGLLRIRDKQCAVGILALLEVANRKPQTLQASDLGFSIAPKINAAGRLADISWGIRCLLSEDIKNARRYAQELEALNEKRKETQALIQQQAQEIVDGQTKMQDNFALSLFDASWHEGVIGIVAGKLKEEYYCPVAVFAQSGDFLKGSVRSINSVHIKDLLDLLDRKHPDLIEKFGGHAMAAGLSIKPENFEHFKMRFSEEIKQHLKGVIPKAELLTDGALKAFDISLPNAELIAQYDPWGQGFEEPIFYNTFELVAQKIVGEQHLKCRLKLLDSTQVYDGIAFFQSKITQPSVQMAYRLAINEWRGVKSLQLMIVQVN